jgi:ribosomal protein S18 acetylase RimI-like enzyme
MTADPISADLFRTKVLLDPNFTPVNLPVAVSDERVVGFVLGLTRQVPHFLQGMESENAWVTAFGVHPDYQRQGIGQALFEHVVRRFTDEGRKTVDISPYVPNYFVPGVDVNAYPNAIAFLENQISFNTLYQAISMGVNLTGFRVPEDMVNLEQRLTQEHDIVVHPVTAADLPELMPFITEHFGWEWYRHAREYLLQYFGGSPQQICFLVARREGEIVGYCQQRGERFGPFGVAPGHRGIGIGRLLLFRCLATMRTRHVYYAYFLWTSRKTARLYALAGFKERRVFSVMRKEL